MEKQEKLKQYDHFVNATLINIYSMSKDKQKIVLKFFDPNDKEHMFILSAALMARDMFKFPIYVETSFWKWVKLNWKIRKSYNRVLRMKEAFSHEEISTPKLLNFEREAAQEVFGKDFKFDEIYEEYFERGLE